MDLELKPENYENEEIESVNDEPVKKKFRISGHETVCGSIIISAKDKDEALEIFEKECDYYFEETDSSGWEVDDVKECFNS